MPDQATTPAPKATLTIRAKMHCLSVEQTKDAPFTTQRYVGGDLVDVATWPRTYRFNCTYDESIPEDQRFNLATPSGSMQLLVDNPGVRFEPGQAYYLDITPAPAASAQEPHRG